MNTVSIIAVCLSALAIVVTIIIAIINSGKSDKKEGAETASERTEANVEIKNLKAICEDIQADVKSMNANFLGLSKDITEVSTATKISIANLEKRMDKFEQDLKEVRRHG